MALYETTRSPIGGQSLRGRPSSILASLVSTLISWNDARVTRNSLAQLSDRELDDIGLNRGDIEEVAARLAR
jgi:uncharacterized protein YjiS (DUF1127 family)